MFFSFSSRVSLSLILTLPLSLYQVYADTIKKEATYYSDVFEGGSTANGEVFSQSNYSAAICGTPLGRLLYVSRGWVWVVVKSNDRPNCNRYPNVIDLSRDAFRILAPTSTWRIPEVGVTDIGIAPSDVSKWFLSKDIFSHLDVQLVSSVPNILFTRQWIEIRGKVTTPSEYVIVYISHEDDPETKESSLTRVSKDGTFSARILLPGKVGKYTFVIARWKSFNTDSYATLTLIDSENLEYPSLPTKRVKLLPKIITNADATSISLPDSVFGELIIKSWNKIFRTEWSTLLFENVLLPLWEGFAQIKWYTLSTESPLDRSTRIVSAFSGNVILERTREVIGEENVYLNIRKNRVTFSFIAPSDIQLRADYYITDQNGEVTRKYFAPQLVDNKLIIPWSAIRQDFELKKNGVSKLEILKANGEAFINIPIVYWNNIWPIISLYSNDQLKKINYDLETVKNDNLRRLNQLRAVYNLSPLILDNELTKIAQGKVDDFIIRKYAPAHIDIDWNDIYDFALSRWFKPKLPIWENIAAGNFSHISLQDGLEESWSHRYAMLDHQFTKIWIWYTVNAWKTYLVQVFGN